MDKVTIGSLEDTTLSEMDKCVNNEGEEKKEITADNEDEGVIHRAITEYEK